MERPVQTVEDIFSVYARGYDQHKPERGQVLDGTYRTIRVEAKTGRRLERLSVHTRPGYRAEGTPPSP